jgi:hypothetical protein
MSYWLKARGFISLQQDSATFDPFSRADTVLLSLLSLAIFLVAAVFALVFSTAYVKQFIIALNATLAAVLGTTFIFDIITSTYSSD